MKTLLLTTAFTCAAIGAQAQVLTISTTNPGGLTHSIGSAIAKTITDTTDINAVVVPAGGSPMPAVAGGEADCGINVAFDVSYYTNGTAFYESEGKHENLRMVAAVLPSQVTLYVRTDAEAHDIADLKGQRYPGGLNAQLAIGAVYDTYLKLAGLSRDDVESIPAQSIVQAANDFASGRNDTFLFSVGSAKVLEVDSSVGGLKALQIDASDANKAILAENLPGATFVALQPGAAPQIVEETNVIAYDLVLFCAESVPDETVAALTQVVHDNKSALAESFKAMNRFEPANMAPKVPGVDYHPGAVSYYETTDLWPPKG
ncbi:MULTISPECIES: TAXI family TRAP transporter solute-binding subunit [Falsihalocynthiibacter]|uniref:TAXI family TRAP transporter solute-binding subunit n=1 Tax=Falsihalocynthiibacter TaxID=2854182 RepID=UPI003002BD9A